MKMTGKKKASAKSLKSKELLRSINALKGQATRLANSGDPQGARAKLLEALLLTPKHWESVFNQIANKRVELGL